MKALGRESAGNLGGGGRQGVGRRRQQRGQPAPLPWERVRWIERGVQMSIRENTGNKYAAGGTKEGKDVSYRYISNLMNCSSIFPTYEICNGTNPNNSFSLYIVVILFAIHTCDNFF